MSVWLAWISYKGSLPVLGGIFLTESLARNYKRWKERAGIWQCELDHQNVVCGDNVVDVYPAPPEVINTLNW